MMKEELHGYLEKYVEYWKSERGSLPMVSFDEDCKTNMYIGEIDKYGYIQWNYRKKDSIIDFSDIEKKYDIKLHSDLKEYFNSYYFLYLEGFIDGKLICLESINEERDILAELEYVFENEGKDIFEIGIEGKQDLPLYFEINTGNIMIYDFDNNDKEKLADSLKELFAKLSPISN